MFRLPSSSLRALPLRCARAAQPVRAFGFSSRSGNGNSSPAMDYIPMPYIEETSVRYSIQSPTKEARIS